MSEIVPPSRLPNALERFFLRVRPEPVKTTVQREGASLYLDIFRESPRTSPLSAVYACTVRDPRGVVSTAVNTLGFFHYPAMFPVERDVLFAGDYTLAWWGQSARGLDGWRLLALRHEQVLAA